MTITLNNGHRIVIPQNNVKIPLGKVVDAIKRWGYYRGKIVVTKFYKNRKLTSSSFLIMLLVSLVWLLILIGSIFIPRLLELKNAYWIGKVALTVLLIGMFYLCYQYFPISFNPKLMRKHPFSEKKSV